MARLQRSVLCIVVVFAFMGSAAADVVHLASGGTVEGSIETILFRSGGKKTTVIRFDVAAIALAGGSEDDVLTLGSEQVLKGELVSLSVRSIGGVLSFGRPDLKSITIVQTPMDKIRETYLRRKATLGAGDAAAHCELAVWCKENKLDKEANDLAQRALALKPDADTTAAAHAILGHVLRDGRWVVMSSEAPGAPEAAPEPEVNLEKVDPALVASMNSVIAKYVTKASEAKAADQDLWRATYQAKWAEYGKAAAAAKVVVDQVSERVRQAQSAVGGLERQRSSCGTCPIRKKDLENRIKAAKDTVRSVRRERSPAEKSYARAKQAQARLLLRMRADRSRIARRAAARKRRISLARSKIQRLLALGEGVSDDQMLTICEQICAK